MMKHFTLTIVKVFVLLIIILAAVDTILVPETTHNDIELAHSLIPEESRPRGQFYHDGCTLFPDKLPWADYRRICLLHDIKYWVGGSDEDRLRADLEFKDAIAHTNLLGTPTSYLAYYGVRLFGDSFITKFYNANWGYGHK